MNQIYFYDIDNIPNYQSRRFGRCSEQLAIRWSLPAFSNEKSRIRAATRTRQTQNRPATEQVRSALSSYHAGLCCTSRKGQFSKPILYIKEN